MKSFILLSAIIIAINLNTACITSDVCDVEERDSVYEHTTFNRDFIKDLESYERLEAFLKVHSDSILAYNPGDCALFYKNDEGKLTRSRMPPSINNEFMVLYKEFDNIALNYFQVCKDSTINIILNRSLGSTDVYHSLRWG